MKEKKLHHNHSVSRPIVNILQRCTSICVCVCARLWTLFRFVVFYHNSYRIQALSLQSFWWNHFAQIVVLDMHDFMNNPDLMCHLTWWTYTCVNVSASCFWTQIKSTKIHGKERMKLYKMKESEKHGSFKWSKKNFHAKFTFFTQMWQISHRCIETFHKHYWKVKF